ncbi:MAG: hypothetical protein K6C09_06550 [Oscillospiraceae bacterium]|nr:hypothetical protein [Oscillospiraceae bacterium]
MVRAENIIISPIRAVLNDLGDPMADFILCSSERDIRTDGMPNVLFLKFFDTEEENDPQRFRRSDAERIAAFLSRPDANGDLFVCCDSGRSRSAAVAAAVRLAAGEDDRTIWESTEYHPNVLVFRIMGEALGLDLSDGEIRARRERSDAAVREAIAGRRGT